MRLLTAAATYFNTIAVADFGGRPGPVRAPGLLEGVIGAAFQTFGGVDPHPGPFDKAAMLLPHAEPFAFTLPSKSRLGYNLPAFAGTGRLKLYQPADDQQARHRGRLLRELETARYEPKGIETLSFSVPIREGHHDYLMSLALPTTHAAPVWRHRVAVAS